MVLVVRPALSDRYGLPVVHPTSSSLSQDDAIDGADVVPGWKLPVREIFST